MSIASAAVVKKSLQASLVLLCLGGALGLATPHFLTADNILNVVEQSAINAILGMGLTFVIISGGIDLSVGSVMALAGLVTADLAAAGHSTTLAIVAGLATGALCGATNGWITTRTRIPPFITTLGMMLIARSAANVFSGAKPISGMPQALRTLADISFGVPNLVWVVVALYAVGAVLLTRTKMGRYTYAIGGNEEAAWLSGVPVVRYKTLVYTFSGLLAGVAAILMTARLNAASPLAGEMYELHAIAAAVIGGTSLMGGEGQVSGTLIGAMIMGVLRNGLNLLNVPSAWEGIVIGTVLIAAVVLDRRRQQAALAQDSSADTADSPAPTVSGLSWLQRQGRRRWLVRLAWGLGAVAVFGAALAHRWTRETTPVVAFIPKTLGSPFWTAMREGAQKEAKLQGVRLINLAPDRETDVERQFQIVQNAIRQQVQAIVLAPSGSKELVPAVKQANHAGIPVYLVDTKLDQHTMQELNAQVETFIGSDNFKGGLLAGQNLAESLQKRHANGPQAAEIAVLEGIPGHETVEQRRDGFVKALEAYPNLRVVTSQTANSERARAFAVTQNILQAHPKLQGIFAANDEMALGALEAVTAARRGDEVVIVGYDATPDAIARIKEGRLAGSVAQFPAEMGRLGVRYAASFIKSGQRPPAHVGTTVQVIDRNNVEAVQ